MIKLRIINIITQYSYYLLLIELIEPDLRAIYSNRALFYPFLKTEKKPSTV